MGILEDIKKDAIQMGTKLQTSEERDIEELLNNLFYLDKNIPEELWQMSEQRELYVV